MKCRLSLALPLLLACFSTGCPDEEVPPAVDGGVTDSGAADPQLVVDPDPSTLAFVEGAGPLTFAVKLSEDPGRSIGAQLASSDPSVLVIDPGETTLTRGNFIDGVTVTLTPQDDEDTSNESVEITIMTEVGAATYTITIVDDDTDNLVVTPTSIALTESATATVEVRLSAPPREPVEIAVSTSDQALLSLDADSLAFDLENWDVAQTVTVTALFDVDLVENLADVLFDHPVNEDVTVPVTITDDDVQSFVVSTSSLTIDEDGIGSFTVNLAFEPTADVSVSVVSSPSSVASVDTSSLTFTADDWNVPQTVAVSGLDDPNVTADTAMITVSSPDVSAAAGVLVTVIDDDVQVIEVTTSTLSVDENGAASFGVRLGFLPPGDVVVSLAPSDPAALGLAPSSLTFTPADFDQLQFVDVAGLDDANAADEAVSIVLSAPDAGDVVVDATVLDDDTLAIVTDAPSVSVGEGMSTTFGVRLSAQPEGDVTVSAASLLGAFTTTPAALTFTPANWDTSQLLLVTGAQDQNVADESDTLELGASGLATASVPVTVIDEDTQAIVVSAPAITVPEGQSTPFQVSLAYQPSGNVTVDLTAADPFIGPNPTAVVFTPADWNMPRTINVAALDDQNTTDEQSSILLSSGGLAPVTVMVTIGDDDIQSILLDTNTLAITEGGSGTFTARLAFQPAATVALSIQSSDAGAGSAAPTTLMFDAASWDVPQPVVVSGTDDADVSDENVTITVSGNGLADAMVAVAITDDDTQALVLDRTAVALNEGGFDTVNVSLAFQPAGNVTVMVASGDASVTAAPAAMTFTPANYDAPQPVTLTAVQDQDLEDESVAVTISSAGLAGETVTVSVTDDDAQALVVNPVTLSVNEGGSDDLSVSLAFQPAADVTVSISSADANLATPSAATLTFTPANYATAQVVAINGVQDADVQDETVDVVVASAGLASVTVGVTVVDDDILNLNVNPTSLALSEGGTAGSFNVSLTQQPASPVTVDITPSDAGDVTLSAGTLTFDANNWDTPQAVNVSPNVDDDALDEDLTLTVSAAGLTPRTVSVTIADDDTQAIVVSATTLDSIEGENGSVTVRLAFDPVNPATVTVTSGDAGAVSAAPATLTFTSANYDQPQTVAVDALQDADTRDETVNVTFASAVAASELLSVSVTDEDVQALVLTTNTVALGEGASQVVGVSLAFDPVNPVTVTAASSDPGAAGANPATFTFNSANYAQPQDLTISGVQDNDTADESATVTVQTAVAPTETITVTVADEDTQFISLNRTALDVTEGGNGTIGVRLGYDPVTPLSVSVASSDAGVATAAPVTLTFDSGNYTVLQNVTVAAPQDDDTQDGSATVTFSSASTADATAQISVNDDDTQAIVVSTNSLLIAEDASGAFTVQLAFNPLAQVTVAIANSDAGAASVAPVTLTFDAGNYDQPQTVDVTGLDDDDTLDENVTLTLSGAGAPADTAVAVTVNDEDVQALIVSQTAVTLDEGATDTSVTVRLAYDPVNPAAVDVVSADLGAATGAPLTLTFSSADYDQPQTVTITGVQDQDLADETVTITLATAIANNVDLAVTVDDDDTQMLVVAPLSLAIGEGGDGTFGVSLQYIPGGTVTVNVASNDAGAASVSTNTLTFDAGNWNQTQNVTVSGVQDIDLVDESTTIDVTSLNVAPRSVAVTVTDEDTQAFVINPTALTLTEGGATGSFDVSLQFEPTGPVTVSVASSDAGAADATPATLTFDPGNFSTPQAVQVAAIADDDTRDESATITVSSADVPVPGSVAVSVGDDDVQALVVLPDTLTVTEEGQPGQIAVSFAFEPDGPTTVNVTSTDAGAVSVSPVQLTFTPADYDAPQLVDVTGVSDEDVVSEQVNVDVTTAIAPAELVVVTVTEDDTQAMVLSTNAVTVDEDGPSVPFTVRLAFQPQADTTVTIATSDAGAATTNPTSLVFTPADYATPQAVNVLGTTDQDQLDTSATLTLTAPTIANETVAVTVVDDDDQAIIVSTDTLGIDEESSGSFTVRLAFVPLAPLETVTVTSSDLGAATVSPAIIAFNAANYSTPVTVTVNGETDEDILDETVTVTLDSDAPATANEAVTVDVNDIDVQDIIVSDAAVTVTEGGLSTVVTVRLAQDPSGTQTVDVTSQDPGAASAAPAQLTFDSANYTVPQTVTLAAVDDDDVRDETVDVEYTTANVATPRVTTVTVNDDDTQAILTQQFPVTVSEGGSDGFNVVLEFRPTNPITVTVTLGDPTIASASPTSLVFDSTNFDVPQRVTVDGLQDADLDDEAGDITLTTGAVPPPEGAQDVVLQLNVLDDDTQVIIAESIPTTLPTSVQEGGPTVSFQISLGFPPRLSEGGTDTVAISSALPNLSFNPSSVTFGQGDFDQPMTVTITAGDDANTATELVDLTLEIVGEVTGTHSVQIVDDEIPILGNTTYAGLTGGTLFTKRQNIRWGSTRLGVVGFDTTTGETRIGSNTRELDDLVLGPVIATGGGGAFSAEAVEFDGTDFRFFATGSNGIAFAGSDETASATFIVQDVSPTNALNFWPAFDGTDRFGLVYREDGALADVLRFTIVQLDGTASTPTTLTVADGSDDVQPNVHFTGAGYTIIYSSASEVRCMRANAAGSLIPGSDTALTGFPAGGAFVSTVYDGTDIVAAYYNATNSINVVRITPSTCAVNGAHAALGSSNVFLSSPPAIAWNGSELAVAYDYLDNNVAQVGVLLVTPALGSSSDYVVGPGSRPSITWAGDRWALRHGDPVQVTVGSFETPPTL